MIENKIFHMKVIWKYKKLVENIPSSQTNFCFEKYYRIVFENCLKKFDF